MYSQANTLHTFSVGRRQKPNTRYIILMECYEIVHHFITDNPYLSP